MEILLKGVRGGITSSGIKGVKAGTLLQDAVARAWALTPIGCAGMEKEWHCDINQARISQNSRIFFSN